jgi:hypothetical protein
MTEVAHILLKFGPSEQLKDEMIGLRITLAFKRLRHARKSATFGEGTSI